MGDLNGAAVEKHFLFKGFNVREFRLFLNMLVSGQSFLGQCSASDHTNRRALLSSQCRFNTKQKSASLHIYGDRNLCITLIKA